MGIAMGEEYAPDKYTNQYLLGGPLSVFSTQDLDTVSLPPFLPLMHFALTYFHTPSVRLRGILLAVVVFHMVLYTYDMEVDCLYINY